VGPERTGTDEAALDAATVDRALAEQAGHDAEAFAQLYRRHVEAIHAFAWRRSGSREVAEDVTATTFERAWASLGRFEWRDGGFSAWLHRIAANELVARGRRTRVAEAPRARAAVAALTPADGPDPAFDDDYVLDRWPQVRAALDTLNPRYQEVISLRYLAGLSPDDAAGVLGCSKANLAVTLHRALRALGRAVERREGSIR
jgi:RNA polymerase sigma-70 factor (ECF subfamily)